jgi:hypothetical protein
VTRLTDTSSAPGAAAAAAGGNSSSSSAGMLAPALGEGWGQAASCRVALYWEGSQRYAMVTKAKHVPQRAAAAAQAGRSDTMAVPYSVGPDGIC